VLGSSLKIGSRLMKAVLGQTAQLPPRSLPSYMNNMINRTLPRQHTPFQRAPWNPILISRSASFLWNQIASIPAIATLTSLDSSPSFSRTTIFSISTTIHSLSPPPRMRTPHSPRTLNAFRETILSFVSVLYLILTRPSPPLYGLGTQTMGYESNLMDYP
jgi:hypothetical protein